jgi:hypothetical protein
MRGVQDRWWLFCFSEALTLSILEESELIMFLDQKVAVAF